MTRKDFQLIARIIHDMPTRAVSFRTQRESCAHAFAAKLGVSNPRFNAELFRQAALGIVPITARKPATLLPAQEV